MRLRALWLGLALMLPLAACVEEVPTDVGGVLLPSGDVLTFEIELPASSFLVSDTAFSGYAEPVDANFALVARNFDDALDANALLRYSLPPATIIVRSGTTTVTDSFPRFVGGSVVFRFDTINSTTRPVRFTLFRTGEVWDASATWTQRVDTGTVHLPWTTPGGTRGAQIDTATWVDGDSVVFDVDSTTLALWRDSTNLARGALLVSETGDSRVRVFGSTVHINTLSSIQQDTVVNVDLVPTVRTFVFNPSVPATTGGIRVGGIPSWRSILRLRTDLRTIVLPCPGGTAGCRVLLDSAHINTAQLLLRPLASPPGFAPEDSLFIEGRSLAPSPFVPIERSPIGGRLALSTLMPPDYFISPGPADVVRLDITAFLSHLLDESIDAEQRLAPLLSILQLPEAQTFGFASFAPNPTLRLVVTTPLERVQ